jgi:tripartite-type tricarboxylate transporter receptor subunit TctC
MRKSLGVFVAAVALVASYGSAAVAQPAFPPKPVHVLGPAKMPPDLVKKLSHDFVAALKAQSVKDRLGPLSATPIGSSPEEFAAKIRADYDKWGPIIKAAGMKIE